MSVATPDIRVTSEIGRLRSVICHRPGPELAVVTPENQSTYLFDDLLDLENAEYEYNRFAQILRRFARVYEVGELLAEVLEQEEAREFIRNQCGDPFLGRRPDTSTEMARLFIEGEESRSGFLAQLVNEAGYTLPPLPNLFFTRDAAAVIGPGVMISAMKHQVRWTEKVIMRTIFGFHPDFSGADFLYDGTDERRMNVFIEGGDVHVLRDDLLIVGLSERTSAAGIEVLVRELFESGDISEVLVVVMPPHRTSIHLDMIFTMIDRELCCVFPPYFIGPTRLPVLHIRRSKEGTREMPNLFTALASVGLPLKPIYCGGEKRTMQEREQWGSGCNFFAVGPGQVLAYERNENTMAALERDGGFRIVSGEALLVGDETVASDDRAVITFQGSELVRGGGGPRCMTMPVLREGVE